MKVVVIGSNSFSGSNFVTHLLKNTDYDVIGMSRSQEPKDCFLTYKQLDDKLLARFAFHQLDLNTDQEEIFSVLDTEKPEYVVNFASQSMVGQSWDHPEHWYRTNTYSTIKFVNTLKDRKYLKKYVHISTPEVYGSCTGSVDETFRHKPSTPYAGSRAAADEFIQMLVTQFDFPAVFTRAANVYGAGQQLFKIIPRAIVYAKLDKKVPLHGGGYARRAFIHIDDVSKATQQIMEGAKPGEIYHLSTTELIAIRDLVAMIAKAMGKEFEDLAEVAETRRGLDDAYILDSTKAKKEFGWETVVPFDEGISEVATWVNDNWDVIKKEELEYEHKE